MTTRRPENDTHDQTVAELLKVAKRCLDRVAILHGEARFDDDIENTVHELQKEVQIRDRNLERYYAYFSGDLHYQRCDWCDEYWHNNCDSAPKYCECGGLRVCADCADESHNYTKCVD